MGETTLQELAGDYLKSEDESLKERIEEIESEIKELEEEEEKYQDLEDDLLQEVKDEKKEKQQERNNLEEKIEDSQELENKILEEILNGFKLEDLNEEVIRAINGIVHGEEKKFILVRGHRIELDEELDIEKKEERLIRHQIKRIAKDITESDEKVEQTWEKIESSKKLGAFEIVADSEGFVSPDKVSEDLEVDRSQARNRLKDCRYRLPLNPYYVNDGDYNLSLLGEYLKRNYCRSQENEQREEPETKESEGDTSEKVTQSKFMSEVSE